MGGEGRERDNTQNNLSKTYHLSDSSKSCGLNTVEKGTTIDGRGLPFYFQRSAKVTEKVTARKNRIGRKGRRHGNIWRKVFQVEGTAGAKTQSWNHAWGPVEPGGQYAWRS